MNVSISNNIADDSFDISITGAKHSDVLAVRSVIDERQGIVIPLNNNPVSSHYANPREWTRSRQLAFIQAAAMFLLTDSNKISAIRHLRSLSDPVLTLKDAKDLVDYAFRSSDSLPWLSPE
jgi:hypothetical protein